MICAVRIHDRKEHLIYEIKGKEKENETNSQLLEPLEKIVAVRVKTNSRLPQEVSLLLYTLDPQIYQDNESASENYTDFAESEEEEMEEEEDSDLRYNDKSHYNWMEDNEVRAIIGGEQSEIDIVMSDKGFLFSEGGGNSAIDLFRDKSPENILL